MRFCCFVLLGVRKVNTSKYFVMIVVVSNLSKEHDAPRCEFVVPVLLVF